MAAATTQNQGLSSFQTAGVWATAIQAVGNIYTSYQSSRSASELASIQERIAEINRKRAVIQAQSALAASNRNMANITQQYGQLKSKQKVAMAANGTALGYGSNKEIIATTDLYKQKDRNTAYANGLNAAMGYMSKATAQYQAGIAASASKSNTGMVVTDSLLSGIQKVAGYYANASASNEGAASADAAGVVATDTTYASSGSGVGGGDQNALQWIY